MADAALVFFFDDTQQLARRYGFVGPHRFFEQSSAGGGRNVDGRAGNQEFHEPIAGINAFARRYEPNADRRTGRSDVGHGHRLTHEPSRRHDNWSARTAHW